MDVIRVIYFNHHCSRSSGSSNRRNARPVVLHSDRVNNWGLNFNDVLKPYRPLSATLNRMNYWLRGAIAKPVFLMKCFAGVTNI